MQAVKLLLFITGICCSTLLPAQESKVPVIRFAELEKQLHHHSDTVYIINFWATWCGPCKEEMPSMEALYHHFKDRNFIFLTISLDFGGQEPVRKFIENHRYQFPVLLDSSGKTLDLFEINKIH